MSESGLSELSESNNGVQRVIEESASHLQGAYGVKLLRDGEGRSLEAETQLWGHDLAIIAESAGAYNQAPRHQWTKIRPFDTCAHPHAQV